MRISLQTRVFLTFVLLIAFFAVAGAVVGAVLISRTTWSEAQRKVEDNLRSAWGMLQHRLDNLEQLAGVMAGSDPVITACSGGDVAPARRRLEWVRRHAGLDFFTVVDKTGRVIVRSLQPYNTGDDLSNDPMISRALRGETMKNFALLDAQRLRMEGGDLEERAFIVFEPTPKAKQRAKQSESAGTALIAAVPVFDLTGNIIGAAYTGQLLNRNNRLVDWMSSTLFGDALYKGRSLGSVTILQWDVRVATTVRKDNGNRAIGTRVSSAVYDTVLENDRSWYGRAFVVNDWYISAYDPIHDADGRPIGILYVGVLAKKYEDIRAGLWTLYGGLSLAAAGLAVLLGFGFSRGLTRSIKRLSTAVHQLAAGDLDHTVPEPPRNDEILDLTRDFNRMAASLRARREELAAANAELARINESLQRVNANYMDMLGFVSHELKNTLGVIYTASKALADGLVGPMTQPQSAMVASICRSVESAVTMARNYMDLARIEKGELQVEKRAIDLIAEVVKPVLADFEQTIISRHVRIENRMPERAPVNGDANLLRIVYRNLIDNALKYGREGGTIKLDLAQQGNAYRLEVWNEGPGLPAEKLERIFDKFVSFSEGTPAAHKSTGLGLFVTREILRRHGGDIRAESSEGEWMNFIMTLPFDGDHPPK